MFVPKCCLPNSEGTKRPYPASTLSKAAYALYVPAALPVPGPLVYRDLAREEVRAMGGARPSELRHYWVRYVRAFFAGEKLQWARDNVLIALVCSLAPGLLATGISAALSDHKWRAAAYATLLTYTGLFALFLVWRLASTPFELDQERQEFITGLSKSLIYTRSKLAALQAQPPAIDAEILELHVQAETTPVARVANVPVDCDLFLRVKLRLRETRPIEVLAYELSSVLYGNTTCANYVGDIQDWGLVTTKRPIGIGTTFQYTVTKLTKLTERLERTGVPVEGWLHFRLDAVRQDKIEDTVYRLNVITATGAVSSDIGGEKNLAGVEGAEFQKPPSASSASSATSPIAC